MYCWQSVGEVKADEEAEQDLAVLESSNQQLVDRFTEKAWFDLVLVQELVSIDLDLNGQDLHLVGGNLHLVGLAVEGETIDWLHGSVSLDVSDWDGRIDLVLGADKGKLNISIQVGTHVLEGHLEFLNATCFLNSKRDDLHACCLVEQLSLAPNGWVVQEAKQQDLELLLLFFEHHLVTLMA